MEIQIEAAAAGDAEALARLAGQLGYRAGPEGLAARLEALGGDPDHRALVARVPATGLEAGVLGEPGTPALAGWAAARVSTSLLRGREGLITLLVVDEAFRGHGIGTALVRALEAWVLERGANSIRVRSRVERDDALRFYARLGYAEQKRQAILGRELA